MLKPLSTLGRTAIVALLVSVLEAAGADHAFAQSAGLEKLDSTLRSRATVSGRSRVIIESDGTVDARTLTQAKGRLLRRLKGHRADVAEVDNRALQALAADQRVTRISIDRPAFPTLERTGAAIGSKLAQLNLGLTGAGVGVVIIDSGITSWHDDLHRPSAIERHRDRIAYFRDFTKAGAGQPSDEYGHGTHVAGIINGSGYDSDGARMGIAPGSHLIVFKVLDGQGNGYISDVIEAIDDAIARKDELNIRIINLSVASTVAESYWDDPLTRAAKRAWDAGIVVVTAAGNFGKDANGQTQYGGITSPGNAPWVITVGAASHQGTVRRSDDTIASFSSRGPTPFDFAAKPDILAPGVGIESLSDPGSLLAGSHASYLLNGTIDVGYKPYLSLSGTSMAAPVVSAVVALMLEANPTLTPNAVKAILEYTAQAREEESYLAQGAGLLNAMGAVRMARFWNDLESDLGPASDVIDGETVLWSRHIIWNNYRVTGGMPLPGANAWSPTTTWGAMKGRGNAPIVWGARTLDVVSATGGRDNIVWATGGRENIVWATGGRENIVWATGGRENIVWATGGRENIVWATGGRENIVWATGGRDNIVWATRGRENIVWATGGRDNIVWATAGRDNIVWATAFAQNLVWANECGGHNCTDTVSAAGGRENIVWATGGRENIVWATGGRDNIVWATGGRENIVWATHGGEEDQSVWSEQSPEPVVWPASVR